MVETSINCQICQILNQVLTGQEISLGGGNGGGDFNWGWCQGTKDRQMGNKIVITKISERGWTLDCKLYWSSYHINTFMRWLKYYSYF